MNFSLFLAVVVSILGHVLTMETPNPECSDLGKLTKALENTVAKVPKSKVDCKTNANCTGLQCSGRVRDRPFNGTVIVEGCHEPVRMLIHANGRRLYVEDGYDRPILKKPIKLALHVNLKKIKNVVYVTLQLKTCLVSSACLPPISLLNKQKIRVQCNGSQKANQSGGDPNPTPNPNPSDSGEATASSGKSSKNQPSIRSRISEMPILSHVLAMDNSNPECSDLGKLTKALENTITNVPDSKVDCKTNANCTGLQCSGKVRDMPFNGTVIVEGCHEPVRMLIHVNGRHLFVRDGYERPILKKPIKLALHVNLKKIKNVVYVTLQLKTCATSSACIPVPLLNKQKIRVQCNGSQKANQSGGDPSPSPNPSDSGEATGSSGKSSTNQPSIRSKISESNGKSLSSGAIAGIVIAVVVFVILIALIVWIVQRKRRRIQRCNDVRMNDDSDPLFFSSDPLA